MVLTILKIRFIQAYRITKELGLLRTLALLVILGFVSFFVFNTLKNSGHSVAIPVVAALVVLSIHASRKDKQFIRVSFGKGYFIFLTEYFLLLLPLLIIFLVYQHWENLFALLLVCLIVPSIYLNVGSRSSSPLARILLHPFRSNLTLRWNSKVPLSNPLAFEWISGLRRYSLMLVPLYLLLLGFSFKPYVAPAGCIVLSLFISGFYYYGEPREYIEMFSRNYKTFLVKKFELDLKYLLIMLMPMAIIAMIFEPSTWYFILGALLLACIIQVITIIFKYALFAENSDLSHNGIPIFINIMCILIPFFWPLPVIMGIKYYRKAQNNLKKYLNDNN